MQDNEKKILETGISFSLKCGKIRIFRSTIVALNEPRYIRFLLNLNSRSFAVQSCHKKMSECFVVPKHVPDKWDFNISSLAFLENIWTICGWDYDKTYRVRGKLYQEQELVVFDLGQAVPLADDLEK